MPDAGPDRFAPVLLYYLRHRPGADEVVDDAFARLLLQDPLCDQRSGGRTRDDLRALIDQEHAVRVAVEGDADVAAHLLDHVLEVDEVLGLDRARGVVGKAADEVEEP